MNFEKINQKITNEKVIKDGAEFDNEAMTEEILKAYGGRVITNEYGDYFTQDGIRLSLGLRKEDRKFNLFIAEGIGVGNKFPKEADFVEVEEQLHETGSSMRDSISEDMLNSEVSSALDFRDLITNIISRYDSWKYSNDEPIEKEKLVILINNVRTGRGDISHITSRYGLRDKVKELLEKQNKGL